MASVVEYLTAAVRRDQEKGGSGFRSTREAADWLGVPIATARRRLWAAAGRGEIEAFDSGGQPGGALEWRIAKATEGNHERNEHGES